MTSLADLLTPTTAQAVRDRVLAVLGAMGFPVTAWGTNHPGRMLVEAFGAVGADANNATVALTAGGFLQTATGSWLDFLAEGMFADARQKATYAQGTVILTAMAGSGPWTITPGVFYVGIQGSGSSNALRFNAITGGTLNPSGTLAIQVQAESPGTPYNIGPGTISTIFTPLPGVTVSNPAIGTTGTWLTRFANDTENDATLRARLGAKWATLGSGFTESAVRYWATSAKLSDGVTPAGATQCIVTGQDGHGGYQVVVAGATGPIVSSDVLAAIQAAVSSHCPVTDRPTTVSATARVVTVTATIYAKGGVSLAQLSDANIRLTALGGSVQIGDRLYLSAVYAVLGSPLLGGTAVDHVEISGPSADVALGSTEVLVVTPVLSGGSA